MPTINSLLEAISWKTYSEDVPFIGVAILSKARGDPDEAFKLALDLRYEGKLGSIFNRLHEAIENNDRPRFESSFRSIQSELRAAAESCGVSLENPRVGRQAKAFYKLATAWLPRNVQDLIEAAVQLLPEDIREWGRKVAARLVTKSPLQMLFLDHVEAVRGVSETRELA